MTKRTNSLVPIELNSENEYLNLRSRAILGSINTSLKDKMQVNIHKANK